MNTLTENKYPLPSWASHQIIRVGGLVEDICKDHHVGHPNKTWLEENDPTGEHGYGIHGCCSCCCKGED